ncbi:MAG: FAD-dependent oxidoreductase [Gemmatirosa sp.]
MSVERRAASVERDSSDEQDSAAREGHSTLDARRSTLSRRAFLAGVTVAGVTGAVVGAPALIRMTRKAPRPLTGALVDDSSAAGHALRDGRADVPVRRVERRSVVIVGGGIAGLSAAWWMARQGMPDVVLLELASSAGGNSRGGRNAVSAYPWGAHYVPVPDARAEYVRLLFAEMGILGADGAWSEPDLCHAPRERTFIHGRWREGQIEAFAMDAAEQGELRRFEEIVATLRASGAFTVPLAIGAARHDVAASPLDGLTADAWLAREGFRSPALRWLVDYGCRDDFGTRARDTSAWAALHYFAARDADEEGPLTWADGNARLVRHLAQRVGDRVVTGAPVRRVERRGRGMRVLAGDTAWECDAVVWAAPTFLASRIVEGAPAVPWRYAPWMVANLTLDRRPTARGVDAPEAWDNVVADSPALGYVVATHQALRGVPDPRTVWTYYWPLADEAPAAARRRLLAMDWRACAEHALADLERAHPDLRACVSRVDVMRYGHAMPRPEPGFLGARRAWWEPPRDARVLYANSDVSGLSLFEEAQHRGIVAADRAMTLVGRDA